MPEAGLTPSTLAALIRIDKAHLVAGEVNHIEPGRHVAARVDLIRPEDGTGGGVQGSHLPAVAVHLVEREGTAVDHRAVAGMTCDVGLDYLTLNRPSASLSGGENQRVKLASFIGQENQSPTLFMFDEPTTGLHPHDISLLLEAFSSLIEKGHTILIVEHNLDIIKNADYVIDLGPEGGDKGGNIVCSGTPEQIAKCPESYTGKYLAKEMFD